MEQNLMQQSLLAAKEDLFAQFEKGLNVVLSTSCDDIVTSRTVTAMRMNDALYLTSIRRPGATKIEQIEKNPHVAICFNTTQITGTAAVVGLVSDTANAAITARYKEVLPDSYARFATAPSAIFIKIDVSTCKSWKMVDGKVEVVNINFLNGVIETNRI